MKLYLSINNVEEKKYIIVRDGSNGPILLSEVFNTKEDAIEPLKERIKIHQDMVVKYPWKKGHEPYLMEVELKLTKVEVE